MRITASPNTASATPHLFPPWARPATPPEQDVDAAFLAGAGLAALDALVHADPPWSGVWRQRLALTAAAASVRAAGRREDVCMLRDAYYLRRLGDDPGPAGRVLVFWRQLACSSKNLDDASVLSTVESLGVKPDAAFPEIFGAAQRLAAEKNRPAVFAAAEMAAITLAHRPDAELLGLWLADAVLARRLKWPIPLALLAGQILDPSLRAGSHRRRPRPGDADWLRSCCLAYARAAAHAVDLSAELGWRAQKLQAVAPKLRAKGAGTVLHALLNEDALIASSRIGNMTDRGLRRLFDRLESLDAVRELSGRQTFRLYGL